MLSAKKNSLHTKSLFKVGVYFFPIFCSLGLQGCIAPIAAVGASGSAAASSAGGAVATAAVANPATATSLASTAATGKSPLEHAASAATKKECSFFNPLSSKPICVEISVPTVTDKSTPLLGPADQGVDTAKQQNISAPLSKD
jgi:hypothetical protein